MSHSHGKSAVEEIILASCFSVQAQSNIGRASLGALESFKPPKKQKQKQKQRMMISKLSWIGLLKFNIAIYLRRMRHSIDKRNF